MPVRTIHRNNTDWFITFTCYRWLPLFEITRSYDLVYKWFEYLKTEKQADILSYVIMPNHFHAIIHLSDCQSGLNKIVANGKRFMAYDIIERLEKQGEKKILEELTEAVNITNRSKKQKHRVFETSFDAKSLESDWFIEQKLDYIHHNPVNGKWNLVSDFTEYEHSSASFYELGTVKHFKPRDYREIWYADEYNT
jgi:REP element-mobilizing transposase RayT